MYVEFCVALASCYFVIALLPQVKALDIIESLEPSILTTQNLPVLSADDLLIHVRIDFWQ